MRRAKSKYYRLYNADNIAAMQTMKDCCVDSIVTDPPYGMSKEPDVYEMIKQWYRSGHYDHKSKRGFMGKEWDAFVPQPSMWKEAYRVLKPGGYCLAFFSTRTYDIGTLAMRMAGFEIRDTISWIYGTGFPKSTNISKQIDKSLGVKSKVVGRRTHPTLKDKSKISRQGKMQFHGTNNIKDEWDITEPVTLEAKKYHGFGSALKPAQELIVLCRKPLSEKTIADNALKWGTGGINIDGCRVCFSKNDDNRVGKEYKHRAKYGFKPDKTKNYNNDGREENLYKPSGRFPANVILTHDARCKMVGHKKVKSNAHYIDPTNKGLYNLGIKNRGRDEGNKLADKDGKETVENWQCTEDCPIHIMDMQSGVSKSSGGKGKKSTGNLGGFGQRGKAYELGTNAGGLGDIGGASRFFYCAKASSKERNLGIEKNNHPTVKPVDLMRYLVRLVTPKRGIVLDPFMGSGTTGIAAYKENLLFVGIERDFEYSKLSKRRIDISIKHKGRYMKKVKASIVSVDNGLFE